MVKLPPINTGERILGENRKNYPSAFWESVAQRDYRKVYSQSQPTNRQSESYSDVIFDGAGNDIGSQYDVMGYPLEVHGEELERHSPILEYRAYNNYVRSKFNLKDRYVSENQANYVTKSTPRVAPLHHAKPTIGIVPANEFIEPDPVERVLPACDRDESVKMSSLPLLRCGRKKKVDTTKERFPNDVNLFEPDNHATPREKQPSRRKYIAGPRSEINVLTFDGGVPATPSIMTPRKVLPHQISNTEFRDDSQSTPTRTRSLSQNVFTPREEMEDSNLSAL